MIPEGVVSWLSLVGIVVGAVAVVQTQVASWLASAEHVWQVGKLSEWMRRRSEDTEDFAFRCTWLIIN